MRGPRLLAALLLAVFAARGIDEARRQYVTYDEPYHIAAGYSMLATGDLRMRHSKPVLSLYLVGLPQLFSGARLPLESPHWDASRPELYRSEYESFGPMYRFAVEFVYKNVVPPETIVLYSRLAVLSVGLLLLWLLYRAGGLLALGIAAFEPNLLGFSGIANQDLPGTAAAFAVLWLCVLYLRRPDRRRAAALGLALGAAVLCKFTNLVLLPVVAAALLPLRRPRELGVAAACAAAAVLAAYRVVHVGEFWRSLVMNKVVMDNGQPTFLAGTIYPAGTWKYYLASLALKSTLPLLLLAAPAFRPSRWRGAEAWVWRLFPLLLLLASSLSPLQIGHRYLLPAYPVLALLAAQEAGARIRRPWVWALLCWHALSSLSAHPHALSYFNELAGGPYGGWRYLVDSNVDWGQDLGRLREHLRREGASDLVLSYFGCVATEAVGMPFEDLYSIELHGDRSHVNASEPRKELLAVSATQRQGLYLAGAFGGRPFAWLDARAPDRPAGPGLFIYDITRDWEAHERLAHLFFIGGHAELARRHARRALALRPGAPWARLLEALTERTRAEGAARARGLAWEMIPWEEALSLPRARAWYRRGLAALGAPSRFQR